ncbi:probable RNA-binding protein 19 [Petaurus breviceps papuanus]|uniref:probable RNA-binding protein 19 n=1 Tax=Petaurus breviceps papuanus TaxID=3040969 RepID=UPI0036D8C687
MSRLIVKNLPSGMKEERFRQLFSAFGTLTDCSLKFTKDGKFRKFGFIGFRSEEEAQNALDHFHRSFIDTSRVTVEFCKSFGDPSKPRAWSKHSQKATQSGKSEKSPVASETQKDKKKKKAVGELEKLKKDAEFQEFLMVHQKRTQVATWANDTVGVEPKTEKARREDDYLNFDSDSGQESEEEIDDDDDGSEKESPAVKAAEQKELSDMDYLKSKVVRADSSEEEEEESEDEAMACEEEDSSNEEEEERLTLGASPGEEGTRPPAARGEVTKPATQSESTTAYTVKLRGAPFNVTEQNVREFLVPLKPVAIRIVRNAHGNKTGYVFVDFSSEGDAEKALKRNKEYMGGRYIEVFREKGTRAPLKPQKDHRKAWQGRELKEGEEEEDLADSGRLFVRNLPYTSTEEDLEKMFAKYGPLSEVHYPIDGLTKKPKGFAFITYMFPEHAVKAYAEVDGQVFQGRMLHVLPSTIKKETSESSDPASSSYKKKKALKDKASSSSSHNWNTLFMGTNAVAEAVAQKYNATKSQVFDHEIKGSVAVRVALGETELVQEVRRFLIENGVSLDSFSQAAGERSKSVILVKNLPVGTRASELQEIFSRYGSLGRVLLPEGGITAIVEYLEPLEARRGFTSLAYSKFHDVPLYLEWAPMGVFTSHPPQKKEQADKPGGTEAGPEGEATENTPEKRGASPQGKPDAAGEEEDEDSEEDESLPGCTLFIKNLNFSTTEETLKEVFSKVGAVKSCTISKKKNKAGVLLSMGFGFVEYRKPEQAQKALKQLQGCMVDKHKLEVKISERAIKPAVTSARQKQTAHKQRTSKILVRNIPFQANVREIRELFSTFGELKTVRLPKKMTGTGPHRGFGFVDFLTKQDAKRAFNALCHSTHLYGRRLVLEWADTEETVQALRRKTAQHFHDSPKKRRSVVLDEILEQLEEGENEDSE